MTGVRVKALSEKGEEGMELVMGADTDRSDWQRWFTERIESDKPFVVVIEHRNFVSRTTMPPDRLKEMIDRQLKKLGLVDEIDFLVEVL